MQCAHFYEIYDDVSHIRSFDLVVVETCLVRSRSRQPTDAPCYHTDAVCARRNRDALCRMSDTAYLTVYFSVHITSLHHTEYSGRILDITYCRNVLGQYLALDTVYDQHTKTNTVYCRWF